MSYTLLSNQDQVQLKETVTISTWTGNQNNLNTHFTGSPNTIHEQLFTSPTSSANFYLNVFQTASSDPVAEVQYSVAYGNRKGSGSPDFTNDTGSMGISPSRTIYSQYQQLVYGDDTTLFTFGATTANAPDDIYVININRARLRHSLKPGSLNLKLTGSLPVDGPSKGFTFELSDDSVTNSGSAVITSLGRQFNIASGANGIISGSTIEQQGGSSSYGYYYPEAGVIILNPTMFTGALAPHRHQGLSDNTDRNTERLFQAISGAASFIVDSQEDINSRYYFIRARNYEFNYTTNSTFVDNATHQLKYSSMITNPKVYITTVGLYNENLELLAVAKLSQPIAKDMTKEALIRVKLDY